MHDAEHKEIMDNMREMKGSLEKSMVDMATRIERSIRDMSKDTKDNSLQIERLKVSSESNQKDINALGIHNTTQHTDLYGKVNHLVKETSRIDTEVTALNGLDKTVAKLSNDSSGLKTAIASVTTLLTLGLAALALFK